MKRDPIMEIVGLLQHLSATLQRQSDQMILERLGVGVSQIRIMNLLAETPDMTQKQISSQLGQTEASISRQVKLLMEKGLLLSRLNNKSRREHLVALTPKGTKLTDAAREVLVDYQVPVIETLKRRQREQLSEALQVMHRHICASGKPFACDRAHGLE